MAPKHEFHVSEEFAKALKKNKKIDYSISRIFGEANWYKTVESSKSVYSLRMVSGLIIPVLALLAMGIAFRIKKKIDILVFVLQILLIADLVYLIN